MFGSIKTIMVEYFDERYKASAETIAVVAIATVTTTGGGAS